MVSAPEAYAAAPTPPRPRDPQDSPLDPAAVHTRRDFAASLTRLRERAGLTVRDIAKATGTPHTTVGGYMSGRHLPPMAQPDALPDILRACGVRDDAGIARWQEALERVRRLPGPRPAGAAAPYRGLAGYDLDDRDWFCGRDRLTRAVVTRLRQHPGAPVTVTGPSGSGKSSLLRAGVIPAWCGPGETAPVVLDTPGKRPLAALASALAPAAGRVPAELAADLRADPGRLAHLLARAGGPGVAVAVDQLEELYLEGADRVERRAFLAALDAAARAGARVVLALRADAAGQALREPALGPSWAQARVATAPMTEDELREAVTCPAYRAGVDLDDALVELLRRELAPAPGWHEPGAALEAGALPWLSQTLRAIWERSRRGRVTVDDYRAVGGVAGVLADAAEAALAALPAPQRAVARRILVRLVRVSQDAPDTRRRVATGRLLDGVPAPAGAAVLERLVAQRLVTVDAGAVRLVHDALLAGWPRMRGWLDAERRA